MRKIALSLAILGATLVPVLYTAPAHAQASRTWVSGVGDDANPCSRTAPCKTWAGAISKTLAGGEIDALDPGGFGGVTITKAITLDGGGGQVASVLVAGTNGITVAAGASDVVIIRNIRINGLLQTSGPGLNGISFTSGAQLVIDRCDIFGFNTNGLSVALSTTGYVKVLNSTFSNNPTGISASSTSGFALVQVVNSSFVGTNSSGTEVGVGVSAGSGGAISVINSNFQDLATGAQALAGGILVVDSSFFQFTGTAITTASGSFFPTNVSNNSFYGSGTAFGGSGSYSSAGNNKIGSGATQGATPGAMTVK